MKVSVSPSANFSYSVFLLTSFPGSEWAHHWISLPIFMGYFVTLMGNATILYLPMHYFLAILAVTDLGLCVSTLPSVLGVLWFEAQMVVSLALNKAKSPGVRHREMLNSSQFTPKYFLLTGLPGLEELYPCLAFPFCFTYIIAIVGNTLILTVIRKNSSLHQPMYLFLAMLAFSELGVSASTLPTVLSIFLFSANKTNFEACLLQMFSIHSFSIMESEFF
ncbi:hypothetical protein A6R68_15917 [Neotoma lepida]|uniref:G-protein coupled receptors family 1 profile domain-containing protein n=1 Tax=Neotoma lepida TaxID=56216 RepID=A0A1A6H6S6_NEOLE|nr:hypothetical protein A6R68_15917 [Neotoma lepida]